MRRSTCYVIWTDGSRNHFSFSYDGDELAGASSYNEFVLRKCLQIFPGRCREEMKWVIKE